MSIPDIDIGTDTDTDILIAGRVARQEAFDRNRDGRVASMRWTRGPPDQERRTWLNKSLSDSSQSSITRIDARSRSLIAMSPSDPTVEPMEHGIERIPSSGTGISRYRHPVPSSGTGSVLEASSTIPGPPFNPMPVIQNWMTVSSTGYRS